MITIMMMRGDETGPESVSIHHFDDYQTANNFIQMMTKMPCPPGMKRQVFPAEEFKEYGWQWMKELKIEDLVKFDDRSIQKMLREIDSQELAKALKGLAAEVQETIFRNMSKRAAEMLREDMEFMGPVRISEVEENQKKICEVLLRLIEGGEVPDPNERMVV